MRTGNLQTLSTRDWESIRERRAFEREYAEKQRLAEDQAEYAKYAASVEAENLHQPRAYRIEPLDFETWRSFMPKDESDPVLRGAQATYRSTLTRVSKAEHDAEQAANEKARQAVAAGKRDPGWILPESAKGLRMSLDEAKTFGKKEADLFVSRTPGYYKCPKNFQTISGYLVAQGVSIPDASVFSKAFERLTALGLLEQRPAPAPAPQPAPTPEPQPELEAVREDQELTEGWDLETGLPRKYSAYEVNRMSSAEYKSAFRVTPRLKYSPVWFKPN